MMSRRYIFIITIILLSSLSSILNNNPGPINVNNNDILKHESNIINQPRSNPLDTTTVYNGETVYVTIDNGTNVHIPTTYSYNYINNITHNITFYDVGGIDDFCIYAPNHWNFTLIGSSHDITYDSVDECWIYSHVGIASYDTFLFLSGETYGVDYARQNQYLTIDDNSGEFLNESSFESELYSNDWEERPAFGFDLLSLNSSIYASGNNSIRLVDTDITTDQLYLSINTSLTNGLHYISFKILIESSNASSFSFFYRKNSASISMTSIGITSGFLNRWVYYFGTIDIDREGLIFPDGLNLFFHHSSGVGVFFIDDFQIWESNSLMVPSDTIHNYNVSSSVISWDLYKNFGISGETVDYETRERNDDILINSTSLTTNSNGYSSYLYENETLGLLEYEVRCYSKLSWFGWDRIEVTETDTTSWISGTYTQNSTDFTHGSYSIQGEYNLTSDVFTTYDPISNLGDLTYIDYIYWDIKSNVSTTFDYWTLTTSSGNQLLFGNNIIVTTSWQEIFVNIDDYTSMSGTYDPTNVDRMLFKIESGVDSRVLWDNLHSIQAQKSFFQPRMTDQRDYFETVKSDSIDFLEGDVEDIILDGSGNFDFTITNGLANITNTGIYFYVWLKINEEINANYYNKLKIRIKSNNTNNELEIFDSDTNSISDLYSLTLNYYEFDITLGSDWKSDETLLSILIYNPLVNDRIFIDFIQLYHQVDINVRHDNTEYFIESENNTLTYSSVLDSITSVFTDQVWQTISSNGIYNMSYTTYLDSNYDTLLIPSDTYYYSLVLTQPNNNLATNLLLMGIQEFIMIFGIIALTMYLMYRVFRKLFKI